MNFWAEVHRLQEQRLAELEDQVGRIKSDNAILAAKNSEVARENISDAQQLIAKISERDPIGGEQDIAELNEIIDESLEIARRY